MVEMVRCQTTSLDSGCPLVSDMFQGRGGTTQHPIAYKIWK
jgi:hypothetical protein